MSEVPAKQCLNCDAPLAGPFCSQCGQAAQEVVLPLRQVLADAVDEFLKWDSRVLRTLWPLLTRPGFLTTEYLAGRRVRYVAPLRLYFFISALSCSALHPYRSGEGAAARAGHPRSGRRRRSGR